ncbi:MAG TPA: hypothetical protein PLN86_16345 [Candidatus Hydrogenedentes bacterium]|nr:hypothetical protein [Candidatus Hydrogenedentota bacterium]
MSSRFMSILNAAQNDEAIHPNVAVRPSSKVIRTGIVALTEETDKAEIVGLRCNVMAETDNMVKVYVYKPDSYGVDKLEGPYYLKQKDVI